MKGRPDLIQPQDLKYVQVDPDPEFNLVHNQEVIEKTIKDNEKLVKARNRGFDEKAKERTNAVAIYLRSLNQGGKTTNHEKFFGKYLTYLRGKEIMEKLKGQMAIQGRNDAFFVIKPSERAKQKARSMI